MTTRIRSLAIESIADMLALADSEERRGFRGVGEACVQRCGSPDERC